MARYRITQTFLFAFVLVTASFPTAAHAGFKDGNRLLSDCDAGDSSRTDNLSWGACMGYILGAADALGFWSAIASGTSCLPPTSQAGQVKDIVVKYLRDNPAKRHFEAHILIYGALKDAFGCTMPIAPRPTG
mgnify:CR=1 FL=1